MLLNEITRAVVSAILISSIASATQVNHLACTYPYKKFEYAGCYEDDRSNRSLGYSPGLEFSNTTVELCTAACKANGFQYAGLEYYGECYCDTSIAANLAPASDCNYTCNGDLTETCGGFNRLSVYHDPTFKASVATAKDYEALGCWTEGKGGRALAWNQGQYLDKSKMTTEYCRNECGAKGYPYVGTEYSQECFCGVQLDRDPTSAPKGDCSMACSGNETEPCGGPDRLNLYRANNLISSEPCGSNPNPVSIPSSSVVPPSSSAALPSSSQAPLLSSSAAPATSSRKPPTSSNQKDFSSNTAPPSSSATPPSSRIAPPSSIQTLPLSSSNKLPKSSHTLHSSGPSHPSQTGSTTKKSSSAPAAQSSSQVPPLPSSATKSTISTKNVITSTKSTTAKVPVTSVKPTSTFNTKTSTLSVPTHYYTPPPYTPTQTNKPPTAPTASCVCATPAAFSGDKSVGKIPLPCVGCNDNQKQRSSYPYKLYNHKDTARCPTYEHSQPKSACNDACMTQYSWCLNYAETFKKTYAKTYEQVKAQCQQQYVACYQANKDVKNEGRCPGVQNTTVYVSDSWYAWLNEWLGKWGFYQ